MIEIKTNGDMIIEEGNNGRSTDNQNLKLLRNGTLEQVFTTSDTNGLLPIPVNLEGGSLHLHADSTVTWKPKLDFLLVDFWTNDIAGSIIDMPIGSLALGYPEDGNPLQITEAGYVIQNGDNRSLTNILPLSQTTIFVHPTTFERYLFNGTTMEVYNDVDEVVPKWLKYEALLSENGSSNVVSTRILNQDENDYLNVIVYQLSTVDAAVYAESNKIIKGLCSVSIPPISDWTEAQYRFVHIDIIISDGQITMTPIDLNSAEIRTAFYETPITIKQRLRGAPPKLISAETNVLGTEVILTFDKKMTDYNLDVVFGNYNITFSGSSGGQSMSDIPLIDGNKLTIPLNTPFLNTDVIEVYLSGNYLESFDYGKCETFGSDFPVINNVFNLDPNQYELITGLSISQDGVLDFSISSPSGKEAYIKLPNGTIGITTTGSYVSTWGNVLGSVILAIPRDCELLDIHCSGYIGALSTSMIGAIDARTCNALTSLSAPNATHVYTNDSTSLTSLSAPNATHVYTNNNISLTSLSAPNATHVYTNNCHSLSVQSIYDALNNAYTLALGGATDGTLDFGGTTPGIDLGLISAIHSPMSYNDITSVLYDVYSWSYNIN